MRKCAGDPAGSNRHGWFSVCASSFWVYDSGMGQIPTLSEVLKYIRLETEYWFAIAVVSVVLLVLPAAITDTIGATGLIGVLRAGTAVVCIVSWSMLLSRVLWAGYKHLRLIIGGRKVLKKLSSEERTLLSEYIARDTKTRTVDMSDGTVMGLVHTMVLYRSSEVSEFYTTFAFNLQPWAWKQLKDTPTLLQPELDKVKAEIATE
jgi:hypothetical protein